MLDGRTATYSSRFSVYVTVAVWTPATVGLQLPDTGLNTKSENTFAEYPSCVPILPQCERTSGWIKGDFNLVLRKDGFGGRVSIAVVGSLHFQREGLAKVAHLLRGRGSSFEVELDLRQHRQARGQTCGWRP